MNLSRLINIILYTFIMLVPILGDRKQKIGMFPVSVDVLFGMAAILLGIIYMLILIKKDKSKFEILKTKEVKYVIITSVIFGVWSFASILWAKNRGAVISECMRLFEYVMLFLIIIINSDKNFIKRAFILFILTMCCSSFVGIFQIFFPAQSKYKAVELAETGKVYSTFFNPNYWGAAVNLVIFYPIVKLIKNKECNKKLNIALVALFSINLIFSWTRSSWLGFGLGLAVLFVLIFRKGLILLPAIPLASLVVPSIRTRFLSIFSVTNWTNKQRIRLWETGFKMLKDHPLTGIGNGNWIYRYFGYINGDRKLYTDKKVLTAHNSYIKEFAELGIIGGVAFIAMYFSLFNISVKTFKSSKKYKFIAAAFIASWCAYIFQNCFNNLMFIPQINVFLWIFSALLYKAYYLEMKEEQA